MKKEDFKVGEKYKLVKKDGTSRAKVGTIWTYQERETDKRGKFWGKLSNDEDAEEDQWLDFDRFKPLLPEVTISKELSDWMFK